MISSCQHLSICGGDAEGPIFWDEEPAEKRPMKRCCSTQQALNGSAAGLVGMTLSSASCVNESRICTDVVLLTV